MKKISFQNDVLPLKNKLYRLALRITLRKEDAEDIVQETLIKVWNRRETWDRIDDMEAFCLTIARNLALDCIKRSGHDNPSIDELAHIEPPATSDPYQKTAQRDRIEIVRTIIDSLPEKQKSCMQLRDFEGKAYKEIADILQISEEQVKINIFRARQTLKNRYEKIESHGV